MASPGEDSEPRQSLRAVVRDFHAGDFVERAILPNRVAHQFARIPVNLVQESAVRRDPVVARAAGNVSAESSGRAIAFDFRAGGILGDRELAAVDLEAADI